MPRARRYIRSKGLYEISFRAVNTIPLVCTEYMRALLHSILARVQRDFKVVIHHYVFEGSHLHILCTALDADMCRRFYGELKKKITDAVKRLLGLERLSLWEDRPSVILIPTLEDAVDKIVYIYSNPSNDNLEESIDRYPGVTSWGCFRAAMEHQDLNFAHQKAAPWIRQRMIPKLPAQGAITERQDRFFTAAMLKSAKRVTHTLEVYPNAWIRAVLPEGVPPQEVAEINQQILSKVRAKEQENRERRLQDGKKVLGAYRLRTQRILKPHTPKKRGSRIFVHTQHNDVRVEVIQEQREVEALCRSVYERWKRGDFSVPWPPGTFAPPLPVVVNLLYEHY